MESCPRITLLTGALCTGFALCLSATLQIQSGLNAAQSSETFSIEANGSSSLGTATLQSGADMRFGSSTPNYTIGEGHDILLARSSGEDEAMVRIALRSPASLTSSELAGSWKLYRFEKYGDNQFHTNSVDYPVQASTFTIDADRNAVTFLDNRSVTFAVNASKDFMVSLSPTPSIDSLFILVRLESGGSTSQMAGSWTVGSFGVDFTANPTDFWYDGDTLTATSGGALTLSEGPANWSANGSGSITFNDGEEPVTLTVSQSRNVLAYADTYNEDQTYQGAIVLRRAASPSIASLAGDWTLHAFDLKAALGSPSGPAIKEFFFPGTNILQRRERSKDGQLHGQPAIEEWDQTGQPTLIAHYDAGFRTYSLAKRYVDTLPSEITETTNDGETETKEYTRYYPGTTNLSSRDRYKNGALHGEPAREEWNEIGLPTLVYYYTMDVRTYGLLKGYDGGLSSFISESIYDGDTVTSKKSTYYHGDGFTPSRRTAFLYGKRNGLQQTWNADGQPTTEQLFDRGIQRSNLSWNYHPNGVKGNETIYDYTGGVDARTTNSWLNTGVRKSTEHYLDGLRHGVHFKYYPSGNPSSEDHYDRGSKEGVQREWFSDPYQLENETYYSENQFHGIKRSWYPNGELYVFENYEKGIEHGRWFAYDDAGRLTSDQTWDYGKLLVKETRYYNPNGSLSNRSYQETATGDLNTAWPRVPSIPDLYTYESYDDVGRKTGFFAEKNGKREGPYQTYQEGIPTQDANYRQGLLHGRQLLYSFDNDGAIISDINYVNGRQDGQSLTYNPENGFLTERSNYRYGKLHGLQELFFQGTEELEYQGEYNDGKKTGLHTDWGRTPPSETIYLSKKETYLDDIRHGPFTSYYNNNSNTVYTSGEYTNGLITGPWSTYRKAGSIQSQIGYANGFLDGESIHYRDDGGIDQRINYKRGVLDGAWIKYFNLGNNTQPREKTIYENNVEIGPRVYYYSNGVVRTSHPLVLERVEGTVTGFRFDGTRASTATYKAGRPHGPATFYRANGFVQSKGTYYNGRQCGTWPYWNEIGEVGAGSPVEYGPCTGTIDPPPAVRWLSGAVTANGEGLTDVTISLGGSPNIGTITTTDGYYILRLPETGTDFNVTLSHGFHPSRETSISLSAESGIQALNFTLDTYDKPNLTVGEPSIKGLHFLEDVTQEVTIPITVDWGNSGATGSVEWEHGDITEDYFDGKFSPGITPNAKAGFGSLIARLYSGDESSPVPFPEYIVHPQPAWSKPFGSWTVLNEPLPGEPVEFRIRNQWPNKPLNIGIDRDTIGELLWPIWSNLPVIGGDLGLFDVQFKLDAAARSDGTGEVKFDGHGEIRAAKKTLRLEAKGKGLLIWQDTLELSQASVLLRGTLSAKETIGTLSFFPVLKVLEKNLLFGGYLKRLNQTAKIEIEMGGGVGGTFSIDARNGPLQFVPAEFELNFLSVAKIGIQWFPLEVDLSHKSVGRALFDTTGSDTFLKKLTLDGTSKAKLRVFEFKRKMDPLLYNITYPSTSSSISASPLIQPLSESGFSLIKPDFVDRNYARFESRISLFSEKVGASELANTQPDHSLATPSAEAAASNLLVSNIYPHANPVIAQQGSTRAIVYTHFDPDRPAGQSTRLYASFDTGNGFSEPAPVHSQNRADFNPQLTSLADGRFIAIWETSQLDQIANELEERIQGLEIAWAIYTPNTQSWSEPALLSNNAYLDFNPIAAASENGLMLAWQSNADNQLMPTEQSPGQINITTWNGNGFETPSALPAGILPIERGTLAYDGTEAVYAWIGDADQDPNTADDSELYFSQFDGTAWQAPIRATTDQSIDTSPRAFCLDGETFELVWRKDNDLLRMSNFNTLTHELIRDQEEGAAPTQFDVTCDAQGRIALIYGSLQEQQSDLRYALYDPISQTWSDEIALTDDDAFEAVPTFLLDPNGKLLTTYLSEDNETEQRDLRWLECELGRDLTVAAIQIDPIADDPGNYTIEATLQNLGALPSGNATLSFYLGDPDSGGSLLIEQSVNLKGGEQSKISVQASGNLEDRIYVRIDSTGTVDELDETNNTASSGLNAPDLAASFFTWDRTVSNETSLTLSGTVTNNGSTEQTDIPIEITDDQGIIHSTTLSSLAPGESAAVTTTLASLSGTEHRFTLSVDPADTLGEPDRSDNTFPLFLSLTQLKDNDGDGMENAWEQLNFGTLDRDGKGDLDGDNLSDVFEFLTLNDPLDEKSKFPFTITQHRTDPDKVLIQFPSAAGRIYRIQRTSDFINWTNDSYRLGTGETLNVSTTGSIAPNQASAFRVSVSLN